MAKNSPHSQQILRRRTTIPLIFLFLILFFLFYSYCSSLLPLSHKSDQNPHLISVPLNNRALPATRNFTFTIKVLAFDRIESLRRCLWSILRADYGGDRVNLHVFVDHFKLSTPGSDPEWLDRKLQEARRILKFVDEFNWPHGEKILHYRTANAGLQAQWLEAWWPCSDDDFAFVVEDDLELSPLYYKFLKLIIRDYYYDSSNFSSSIFGASLQRPRFVPGKHGNKLQLENGTQLFVYQLVGTWGQLLFPRPWKEFRLWYDERKSKGIPPVLEGMVTNGWYKKMGEKIWTPWFIKFIHSRGYFNIYTHFGDERALSVSHRDTGVNYAKTAGPDSILLDQNYFDLNHWKNPPVKSLKWYDFCFGEVRRGRIVKTLDQLGFILNSVHKQGTVILVSLFNTPQDIARNLICHFQRLNISNYLLLGANSALLVDLARTGHAVVDSGRLLADLKARNQDWKTAEFSLKSQVLQKSLESGFDTWLLDGGIALPLVDFSVGSTVDFLALPGAELFYGRGSAGSAKAWSDVIKAVVDSSESGSFVSAAAAALEARGFGKMLTVESPEFALTKLDEVSGKNSSSLVKEGKKLIYWVAGTSLDDVLRSLVNLGAWLLDGDSSCAAVYCHRS
ncbi:transferring glycosyl group transferase [Wolffia australiana]